MEECRIALLSFNPNIKDNLNAANVARILGMMARTHNSLTGDWQSQNDWNEQKEANVLTWNSDIFMQTLLDLAPHIVWKDIVKEFDHTEFIIKDKTALKLTVQAIKRVIRDNFPIEYIYRTWKNTEGQVITQKY